MSLPKLPPNQRLAAPNKWPVVGEKAPRKSDAPWTITVQGCVKTPLTFTLAEIAAMPQSVFTTDIHCVTRWSKPQMTFTGVWLADMLNLCLPLSSAQYVSFIARSERGHSTSLLLADALALPTLIALTAEGEPLEEIHGGPIRTIVAGRYFYKSVKWLERIELLTEDKLGYWEAETGYHNHADPWAEERYIAPNIPAHVLNRALQNKDFTGLDLRGLLASNLDLASLQAQNALLRDAHFENANLAGANFTNANLSNAHFNNANLVGASFLNADVEGADFAGANITGADFTGASLFGTTFD
jgi:DMSO/TMAO reductase YedYZ molybdopterin-dependent catalytic subunit